MKTMISFLLGMFFSVSAVCGEFAELKKLAEQGDSDAQFELGLMYDFGGDEVPQNYINAFRWYMAAAEQGDVAAQVAIGTMFSVGKGVKQDFSQALKWFRKAAEKGNGNAQIGLGTLYAEGLGVEQNYITAYAWHKMAAMQGDDDAVNNMRKVAAKMTPAEVRKAEKLSDDMFNAMIN